MQDAKKGVLFIDFPPVLQLQLKRFEYDFMRDTMVKVIWNFLDIFGACFSIDCILLRSTHHFLGPDSGNILVILVFFQEFVTFRS